MTDKDFFLGLTPFTTYELGPNISPELLYRIGTTYELTPGIWTKVQVPVQCHIVLEIVLLVSIKFDRMCVKSKTFVVGFNDLEARYTDLKLAQDAVKPLETIYFNQVLGSKDV